MLYRVYDNVDNQPISYNKRKSSLKDEENKYEDKTFYTKKEKETL